MKNEEKRKLERVINERRAPLQDLTTVLKYFQVAGKPQVCFLFLFFCFFFFLLLFLFLGGVCLIGRGMICFVVVVVVLCIWMLSLNLVSEVEFLCFAFFCIVVFLKLCLKLCLVVLCCVLM